MQDVDYDNAYYKDLSLAKQNGETLTELTVMMDSQITGYTYVNLKVDGEYFLKNELFDDCIENYVLYKPVKLNNNTDISLEIMVSDEYKKYFYPYYYTVNNLSKFEVGPLSSNFLNSSNGEIYFYTKHNVIDNNNKIEVRSLRIMLM